jgi:hypothetical protein
MTNQSSQERIANGDLPNISPEEMKRYQDCSTGVVERHHICGGCMKGQFYCDLFKKWHERWDSLYTGEES